MRSLAALVLLTVLAPRARGEAVELVFPTEPPAVVDAYELPVTITPAQRRLFHYLYVTYPNYVATLADRIRLAEATIEMLAARIDAYRPFRSFHESSPTWTAEQNVRLALLAAENELAALRRIEAELPYYHRKNVALLKAAMQ